MKRFLKTSGVVLASLLLSACEPADPSVVGYGPRPANAPPPTQERINEERSTGVKPLKGKDSTKEEMDPAQMEALAEEFVRSMEPPAQPESWASSPPSAAERADWAKAAGEKAAGASAKAKQLYSLFPDHPMADVARRSELEMLRMAVNMGAFGYVDSLETLELQLAKEENSDRSRVFEIRFMMARHRIRAASQQSIEESDIMKLATIRSQALALHKEFPGEPRVYELLSLYSGQAEGREAIEIAEMISDSDAADEKLRHEATKTLMRLDPVGRKPEIEFETTEGKTASLSDHQGKLVLLHFWASWNGDSIDMLAPLTQMVESKKEPVAALGINLDLFKSDFDKVSEKQPLPWPQMVDGKGYDNPIAEMLGITELPASVLFDKDGKVLRNKLGTNAVEVVEALVAETNL